MTDLSYIMLIRITITVEHETAFILSLTFHCSMRPGLDWLFLISGSVIHGSFHLCKIRLDRKISPLWLNGKRVGTFREQPSVGITCTEGLECIPKCTKRIASSASRPLHKRMITACLWKSTMHWKTFIWWFIEYESKGASLLHYEIKQLKMRIEWNFYF